jgi:hypothetical protein
MSSDVPVNSGRNSHAAVTNLVYESHLAVVTRTLPSQM